MLAATPTTFRRNWTKRARTRRLIKSWPRSRRRLHARLPHQNCHPAASSWGVQQPNYSPAFRAQTTVQPFEPDGGHDGVGGRLSRPPRLSISLGLRQPLWLTGADWHENRILPVLGSLRHLDLGGEPGELAEGRRAGHEIRRLDLVLWTQRGDVQQLRFVVKAETHFERRHLRERDRDAVAAAFLRAADKGGLYCGRAHHAAQEVDYHVDAARQSRLFEAAFGDVKARESTGAEVESEPVRPRARHGVELDSHRDDAGPDLG